MVLRMFGVDEKSPIAYCIDVNEKESTALMTLAMGGHQLRMLNTAQIGNQSLALNHLKVPAAHF